MGDGPALLVLTIDRPPDLEYVYMRALLARRELAAGPAGSAATIAHLRGRFEGLAIACAALAGAHPDELERAPALFDQLWAEHEAVIRPLLAAFERQERQAVDAAEQTGPHGDRGRLPYGHWTAL